VKISANATVSTGSVTNVSFFNSSSLLGSSQSAPFSVTANSLGAGSYFLTAVATAAGISATSSVVNISVVTPVNTALSSPTQPNNEFVFSYNVNPGLRYVIESAPDLSSPFTPVTTNVPADSPAFFTNPISEGNAFFRVGRMPNP
jgi:chitinase